MGDHEPQCSNSSGFSFDFSLLFLQVKKKH